MAITVVKVSTAVRQFLAEDTYVRQLSAGRRKLYKRTMDSLLRVTDSQLRACELRFEHIEDCINDLMDGAGPEEAAIRQRSGWAARTGRTGAALNSDIAALRAFVDFLHHREYLATKHEPAEHLKTRNQVRRFNVDEMVLPTSEFGRLLDAAGKRHPRDRAIFALGLFAGFRDSEIKELLVSGVNFEKRTVSVWRPKQQRWHTVPLVKGLERELRNWFGWMERTLGPLQKDWHVIGAMSKGPAGSRRTVDQLVDPTRPPARCRDIVSYVFRDLGITDVYRVGTHTLRRMAANAAMDYSDGDIRAAKELLGHDQEKTTEGYLQKNRNLARLQAAIGDFDPLAGESEQLAPVVDLASRRHVA